MVLFHRKLSTRLENMIFARKYLVCKDSYVSTQEILFSVQRQFFQTVDCFFRKTYVSPTKITFIYKKKILRGHSSSFNNNNNNRLGKAGSGKRKCSNMGRTHSCSLLSRPTTLRRGEQINIMKTSIFTTNLITDFELQLKQLIQMMARVS